MSAAQGATPKAPDASAAVRPERIEKHLKALVGVRHPVAAPDALRRACGYIEQTLRGFGYAVHLHGFDDGGKVFHNVVATRTGSRLSDKRILVLAHFDTVAGSPGADDNASGVAVLLELAEALKGWRPEKTLHFVGVNLEENADEEVSGTGLRGSRALAGTVLEEGWDVEAVLVLESVAFAGKSARQTVPAGLPIEAPGEGDFLAVIGNERSRGLVEGVALAARSLGELPVVPLVVPGNGELFRDVRRSDHAPFWDAGFPAVMLTDTTNFRNPHYHQPGDTLDTLNLPFAAGVCRATAALLFQLAGKGTALP